MTAQALVCWAAGSGQEGAGAMLSASSSDRGIETTYHLNLHPNQLCALHLRCVPTDPTVPRDPCRYKERLLHTLP